MSDWKWCVLDDNKKVIENHQKKLEQEQSNLSDNQDTIKKAISDFYTHIITIIGLLVAVFAIIGINFNSFPKIETDNKVIFVTNIMSLNLSLIYCLFILFYLISRMINTSKKQKSWYTDLTMIVSFLLIVAGLIYLNIIC
jgi:hypothetical protein